MIEPLRKRVEELAVWLTTDCGFDEDDLRQMERGCYRPRKTGEAELADAYMLAWGALAKAERSELKKAFNENQKA